MSGTAEFPVAKNQGHRTTDRLEDRVFHRIGKYLLTLALGLLGGWGGSVLAFTGRLTKVEEGQQDLLYIQCNALIDSRVRGLVRACRDVPPDARLGAALKDTT